MGARRRDEFVIRPTGNRRTTEFVSYCLVGLSGVGVNLGAYWVATRMLSVPMELASPLAIELSIVWAFLWNDRWTFARRVPERGWGARCVRFHIVCVLAGIVNYVLLLVLVGVAGWWDLSANAVGIAVGTVVKFMANSAWAWRESFGPPSVVSASVPRGGGQ